MRISLRTRSLAGEVGALFVILGITAWSIWPYVENPTRAWQWGGDDGLITWQINSLGFDGNIFYPYKNTGAYGALLDVSGIMGRIAVEMTGNPVAAYNTALIVGGILTSAFIYGWFREMAGDGWGSVVGTVAFILSGIRMGFIVHIHFWIMQWMVLSAWMMWKYAVSGKVKFWCAAAVLIAVQFWESFYQAYWLVLWVGVWLMVKRKVLIKDWKHWVAGIVIAGVLIWPAARAYVQVYRDFGYGGSIREAAHFSSSINDIWGGWRSLGLYVLLAVAMLRLVRPHPGEGNFRMLLALLVFGVVMALGPVLKWQGGTVKIWDRYFVPLPYGILYYLLPGFSALRSVHRWMWVAGFAASGVIAMGLSRTSPPAPLLNRVPRALRAGEGRKGRGVFSIGLVGALVVAIVGGTIIKSVGEFPTPDRYPAVYKWLASAPGNAILEYPPYTWVDAEHGLEMYRMVYSLVHGKALVGGASGFIPPERYKFLMEVKERFPDADLVEQLKDWGVDYVVVHKNEGKIEESKYLEKVWEDESDVVYELVM